MSIHSRSRVTRHLGTSTGAYLNGWWDFLPLRGDQGRDAVPTVGWERGAILVPSFWTKPGDGVRRGGDRFFRSVKPEDFQPGDEFLFDAFGYPLEWTGTRAGWLRREFHLPADGLEGRWFIGLDAVCPRGSIVVNGQWFAGHDHPTLPLSLDITEALRPGRNELAVLVEDYRRDERGRALVPTGNWIPVAHSGVWQDVYLVRRGAIHVEDTVIRTSTRERRIAVRTTVRNARADARTVVVRHEVVPWTTAAAADTALPVLAFSLTDARIDGGATAVVGVDAAWPEGCWWSPESPRLYLLRTTLEVDGTVCERVYERFGFREVWIEGPDLMLNDHPVHLFSDWGHKATPYYYTEGWIRQWFGMIRDANLNHSRLHTHPHPTLILDLADETGILITGETGMHGAGGAQAADSPPYWDAARDHVRRFIDRDRNRPSVILWSVENEMRWNRDQTDLAQRELPAVQRLMADYDPTRPAYHDGDTSLWNERQVEIVSRHYGKECAGLGWWDRTRPLHSGEMSVYHYSGPNNTLHIAGDDAYASYEALDRAAAWDTAAIVEAGRTRGVCCFGPWNLSCLDNLRLTAETVCPEYADWSLPGVKPLRVPAHSSEFAFWEEGKGYVPGAAFAIQRQAFRPVAVIDLSLRRGYLAGGRFERDVVVVNDAPHDLAGELRLSLGVGGSLVASEVVPVRVPRGRSETFHVAWPIPRHAHGPGTWQAVLSTEGKDWDLLERPVQVGTTDWDPRLRSLTGVVALFGPGTMADVLTEAGVAVRRVPRVDAKSLRGCRILVIEPHAVRPGSDLNRRVLAFVRRGGRAIVLEQTASLFPSLALDPKPVNTAFVRAPNHPVLEGLANADFAYWGDDPYALVGGNALVARHLYRKDDGSRMLALLDAGEGGFGHGDLARTPLFESVAGEGLVLACQLRLDETLAHQPAARHLLANLLRRADAFVPRPRPTPMIAGEQTEPQSMLRWAAAGGTVVLDIGSPAQVSALGAALGIPLTAVAGEPAYQAVRVTPDPVLDGIGNEDTCGITTWTYAPAANRNTPIGSVFLRPTEGLEVLLQTPTQSCLRELFVEGGKTEPLRAHTLSRFLHAEKPEPLAVLARLRHGDGQILLQAFHPTEAVHPGLGRYRNRLLANLGQPSTGSLLDGKGVPAGGRSRGHPEAVQVCREAVARARLDRFVECCSYASERMAARPILKEAAWQVEKSADGTFTAATTQPLFLYGIVSSDIPRRNVVTDIAIPNPEALTFLDLQGGGRVQVWVNGVGRGVLSLREGPGTVSDITLEAGFNHVLIRWEPDAAADTLCLRWRTIMREPETSLGFL